MAQPGMPDPEPIHSGQRLGNYRVERLLGRGGMGAVFLATDLTLHRPVALKVLSSRTSDRTAHKQLLREARNAAALVHPNICTIHEVAEVDGVAFIAMEFVDGRSLRDRLDEAPLSLADALRIGIQAADALAWAHDHGVIHRDFKAANVILSDAGRPKIVDFGLARRDDAAIAAVTTMTSVVPEGAMAGTPYAMAPEQIRGEPADGRTDVWALGVLLYEMVTGGQPFGAATIPELFSKILTAPPAPVSRRVSADVGAVIQRCLEKDSNRRYQHAAEVREALAAIEAGLVPLWQAGQRRIRRRPWLLAVPVIASLVLAAVLDIAGLRTRVLGTGTKAPIRVAVLPFRNLTGDPDQEYFSDGLTDEMIATLGRLHPAGLSVIARTSSMRYKGRDVAIDQIRRELGVDYVVEGSARRDGDRVSIRATLVDAHDQTERWSDTFERDLSGILTLQNDVARGVAGSLSLMLLPSEETRLASARPVVPEAYEAYLKGRFHWQKLTPRELETAMSYFETAVQKDPLYALPYTGIGTVWALRCNNGLAPCNTASRNWKAATQKAHEIDPLGPEAAAQLAAIDFYVDWNWNAAESQFQRALDLDPAYPETHIWYAEFLVNVRDRIEEGLREARRAVDLDPQNSFYRHILAQVMVEANRPDEAIAELRQVLVTDPDLNAARANLQDAYERKRMYADAFAVWHDALVRAGDPQMLQIVERGYAEGGYQGAMRARAELAVDRSRTRYIAPSNVAGFYARAGNKDAAFDWLERAYQEREIQLVRLKGSPKWDGLRSDARFTALLRKVNLAR